MLENIAQKRRNLALDGAHSAAYAMKQINPDVVAAYPITPQTEIVQKFSEYVSEGEVDTEFITAESEHSAMSACIGAAAAGGRVMTATSANGLALMWEVLYIASGNRLPIVMPVVNRALSAPINIHCDHSDSMGARDSGWIQLYSENAQEVYDNIIQAIRIAEHPEVLLPVMVCQDGFITGHALERVEVLDDQEVKKFIGEYKPQYPLLDIRNPVTYGPLDLYDYYFEHKRQQIEAMKKASKVIIEIGEEYSKLTGRNYHFMEEYKLCDAQIGIVTLSSTAGTTKFVVDQLRQKGVKVGLLKLRVFRPFPGEEIIQILKNLQAVAILDRSVSFGAMKGPLYTEISSALYELEKKPLIKNYIYGLGGRDIHPQHLHNVFDELLRITEKGEVKEPLGYLGLRE